MTDPRRTPMSFALRPDVRDRLAEFRKQGGVINVSQVCSDAISRELGRAMTGNRLVERLRVELVDRRGPEWTLGYQEGQRWAETIASWLEITEYATRYDAEDIEIVLENPGSQYEYLTFAGAFVSPPQDYERDSHEAQGAPAFVLGTAEDGRRAWEDNGWKCRSYWRAWLSAVKDVYEAVKDHLPSVENRLRPATPGRPGNASVVREVDPDDIPF